MAICFLCGEGEADYTTTVLVHQHRNLGEMLLQVHMNCLLEKGGTYWDLADTPQLTEEVLPTLREMPHPEAVRRYTQDARRFQESFPKLAAELNKLRDMVTEANSRGFVVPGEGPHVWYGVLRPVDSLCHLRRWWEETRPRAAYLEYEQGQLL